jgi:polysaccharide export outer membrane protein
MDPYMVDVGVDPMTTNATNMMLMPGDTVLVPRVGNVYVLGQVKNEGAYPLSSNAPVTVMRALSLAGGLKYGAALSKARVIRTMPGSQRNEIRIDLKQLMDGKIKDIALASDDILLVPSNAFKSSVAAGGAGVAASLLYGVTYAFAIVK